MKKVLPILLVWFFLATTILHVLACPVINPFDYSVWAYSNKILLLIALLLIGRCAWMLCKDTSSQLAVHLTFSKLILWWSTLGKQRDFNKYLGPPATLNYRNLLVLNSVSVGEWLKGKSLKTIRSALAKRTRQNNILTVLRWEGNPNLPKEIVVDNQELEWLEGSRDFGSMRIGDWYGAYQRIYTKERGYHFVLIDIPFEEAKIKEPE